jgi:hypothetical protein
VEGAIFLPCGCWASYCCGIDARYNSPSGFKLTIDFASGAMSLKEAFADTVQKETLKKPEKVVAHAKKLLAAMEAEEPFGEIEKNVIHYVVSHVEAGMKTLLDQPLGMAPSGSSKASRTANIT